MATRVVNIRTTPYEVYIGRPGPFGNPYVIGPDGDRDEVIRKFRMYFHQRLKIDPDFKVKVEALRGRILGCYCKPLDCHGDTIIEWIETSLMKDVT